MISMPPNFWTWITVLILAVTANAVFFTLVSNILKIDPRDKKISVVRFIVTMVVVVLVNKYYSPFKAKPAQEKLGEVIVSQNK